MKERLHTADHVLCTILENKFEIKTGVIEFSEDSCRIGYECETDLRPFKGELEQEVNRVIRKNHDIISYKPQERKQKNNRYKSSSRDCQGNQH